jgi:hypothetical protein
MAEWETFMYVYVLKKLGKFQFLYKKKKKF